MPNNSYRDITKERITELQNFKTKDFTDCPVQTQEQLQEFKAKYQGYKNMNNQETSVYLKCSCGCSMLVVEKSVWDDGDIDYNISVQDSRYDHNYTTLWGRLKSAITILFGKPVYYSDVYIDSPEKFKAFVGDLNKFCLETKE